MPPCMAKAIDPRLGFYINIPSAHPGHSIASYVVENLFGTLTVWLVWHFTLRKSVNQDCHLREVQSYTYFNQIIAN